MKRLAPAKLRCRRCPFRASSGRCLDPDRVIRSRFDGRTGSALGGHGRPRVADGQDTCTAVAEGRDPRARLAARRDACPRIAFTGHPGPVEALADDAGAVRALARDPRSRVAQAKDPRTGVAERRDPGPSQARRDDARPLGPVTDDTRARRALTLDAVSTAVIDAIDPGHRRLRIQSAGLLAAGSVGGTRTVVQRKGQGNRRSAPRHPSVPRAGYAPCANHWSTRIARSVFQRLCVPSPTSISRWASPS